METSSSESSSSESDIETSSSESDIENATSSSDLNTEIASIQSQIEDKQIQIDAQQVAIDKLTELMKEDQDNLSLYREQFKLMKAKDVLMDTTKVLMAKQLKMAQNTAKEKGIDETEL